MHYLSYSWRASVGLNCTAFDFASNAHRSQPDSIVPVLARGHLSDKWAMVAIMGVQSSGKSTLLNLLFGTSFRQMNNRFGRSQTTLGVWIDTANVDDVVGLEHLGPEVAVVTGRISFA